MNTTDTKPVQTLFLIHNLVENASSEWLLPKNNYSGTFFCARLFNARLEASGQSLKPVSFAGPFNQSIFLFQVVDAHEAAKVILAVMEEIGMAPCGRLFRFDEDELIWRCVFPAGTPDARIEELLRLGKICLGEIFISLAKTAGLQAPIESKPQGQSPPANPTR